jgi:hypothetical protein
MFTVQGADIGVKRGHNSVGKPTAKTCRLMVKNCRMRPM